MSTETMLFILFVLIMSILLVAIFVADRRITRRLERLISSVKQEGTVETDPLPWLVTTNHYSGELATTFSTRYATEKEAQRDAEAAARTGARAFVRHRPRKDWKA